MAAPRSSCSTRAPAHLDGSACRAARRHRTRSPRNRRPCCRRSRCRSHRRSRRCPRPQMQERPPSLVRSRRHANQEAHCSWRPRLAALLQSGGSGGRWRHWCIARACVSTGTVLRVGRESEHTRATDPTWQTPGTSSRAATHKREKSREDGLSCQELSKREQVSESTEGVWGDTDPSRARTRQVPANVGWSTHSAHGSMYFPTQHLSIHVPLHRRNFRRLRLHRRPQ